MAGIGANPGCPSVSVQPYDPFLPIISTVTHLLHKIPNVRRDPMRLVNTPNPVFRSVTTALRPLKVDYHTHSGSIIANISRARITMTGL